MDSLKTSLVDNKTTLLVSCLGAIEVILLGLVIYFLSQLVGNNDTSNNLSKTVTPILGILGAIVFVHTIMWILYSTHNPLNMNMYFLLATSFSFIISLTALSISIVNKS